MRDRWLSFFIIGVLTITVFIFFFLRNQPIKSPVAKQNTQSNATITQPTITFVNPSRGAIDAQVAIIEYADFSCEVCKQMIPFLDAVIKTYPNQVRLVWKDMPNNSVHPEAENAAVAAHCADKQKKFWEYHNALFERQMFVSETQYTQIAKDIGLNAQKFSKCYSDRDTLPIVKKDLEEGIGLGLVATPSFVIGNQTLVGLQSIEELINAVERVLHPATITP